MLAAGGELESLRVALVSRSEGRDDPATAASLAVFVGKETRPRWQGELNAGVAEVVLAAPIDPQADVRIEADGAVVASGKLAAHQPAVATRGVGRAATFENAGLTLAVEVTRGALVPPFPERVRLSLRDGATPTAGAEIIWTAVSAEPASGRVIVDEKGAAEIEISALAQPVLLSLEARIGSRTVSGEATLPVSMSGIYLSPSASGGGFELVSPGPRKTAYLSLYDGEGRYAGAVVPLTVDEKGFSRGRVSLEPARPPVAVVVSGEPSEKGPSTVTWPPPGTVGTSEAPRLELVLDGMGAAIATERTRIARVRTLAILSLSLAAALEIALLLWVGRRESKNLAALGEALSEGDVGDLAEATPQATPPIGSRQSVLIVSVVALVLVMFVAVAHFSGLAP